ncbi:lytic polysaccharide monooxygenase [Saccharomonospora piscinae]|uniref:lytic polysaccharide monooxygenase auxiliary activity family 9 protein n=1 Tax=Saccharomonospora piscinae TaxID=687388 RepID=UPI0004B91375
MLRKALLVFVSAVVAATGAPAAVAVPHGSVVDPPTRNYGCWDRWGDKHLSPAMKSEDPMCWQAYRENANAMWDWNGLYREDVGGKHREAIPDGQLCSGGRTHDGRYAALDLVGQWRAAYRNNLFTMNAYDSARHGADYYHVYITEQGFDPLSESLGWDDLELVKKVGSKPPAENTHFTVDAGERSGRHIVYTIWQASHMDQSYYLCSDVVFTGAK